VLLAAQVTLAVDVDCFNDNVTHVSPHGVRYCSYSSRSSCDRVSSDGSEISVNITTLILTLTSNCKILSKIHDSDNITMKPVISQWTVSQS